MDVYIITLRLAHVVGGVFWAGGTLLLVRFLQPAVQDAGRAGGQLMGALMGRLGPALGGSGAITILSGVLLFWRDFGAAPAASASMVSFGIGGLAGLVAWILGAVWIAPAGRRLAPLMQRLADGEEVQAEISAITDSRQRQYAISGLLVFTAVVLMSVARYL